MSAKAKAQEVGPAVGTWSKMQLAYKMETGKWGDAKAISYKVPGGTAEAPDSGATSNFAYKVDKPDSSGASSGKWEATSKFAADQCTSGKKWDAEFKSDSADDPEVSMSDSLNCVFLTPSYYNIGAKK